MPTTQNAQSSFSIAGDPYEPGLALLCGQFVQAAYDMFRADMENLTPPPSPSFPAGYSIVAWIVLSELFGDTESKRFSRFAAHSHADANRTILAIRGTADLEEWWDDAHYAPVPFERPNCGNVPEGFDKIYRTMSLRLPGVQAASQTAPAGGFAMQVSDLVKSLSHSAAAPVTLCVTGHSLGSVLATYFSLEYGLDAIKYKFQDQIRLSLYTLASPRPGDGAFVAAFNALRLNSWRIINLQDLAPWFPPGYGYTHVNTLAPPYDSSGKVRNNPGCWHALKTYLSLIDPRLLPSTECRLPSTQPFVSPAALSNTEQLSHSEGPVTVNIAINIGPRE